MSSSKWTRLPNGMEVEAEALADTQKAWRARNGAWEFGVKADVDTAVAEVHGGSAANHGAPYGGVVEPDYTGWVAPATQPLVVAELLQSATTSSNLVREVKQSPESTDDSGYIAEGGTYGSVVAQVEPQDFKVQNSVAMFAVSEDILADASSAAPYIAARATKLALLAEQYVIVNGDGTGNTFLGMINASDTQEAVTTAAQSGEVDTSIAKLMGAVFDASGVLPTWMLANQGDWVKAVTKRASTGGPFLSGGFGSRNPFGMKLALSKAVPAGTIILGSEDAGVRYLRSIRVASSTDFNKFWGEGLVAIRATVRSTVAWTYPSAIGTLTSVTS